jgi:hypothetical protein
MRPIDRDSRETIDYLRDLPEGAVVRWASDHITRQRPFARGWIDIRIADGGPPDMGWVWTILTPEDPDPGTPEQLWQFPWPYDDTRGWSVRTVCDALSHWAIRHARRADLTFEWAPEAPASAALERAIERATAGGPTRDLGDGLEVADGVMDDLLALDPDEAARIEAILRESSQRFRRETQ